LRRLALRQLAQDLAVFFHDAFRDLPLRQVSQSRSPSSSDGSRYFELLVFFGRRYGHRGELITILHEIGGDLGAIRWRIAQLLVQTACMKSLSFSDARANFKAVMDKVVADKAPIAITRRKAESVVMVSESEWASIEETLHLLSSPKNAERLLEAVRGLEAGDGEEHDLIEAKG
jgi:antitoxin YefM